MSVDYTAVITDLGQRARAAALRLSIETTERKNDALQRLASALEASQAVVLAANERDVAAAKDAGLAAPQIDRLTLTPARLNHLAESVRQVALLPDPVGEILEDWTRPNGLRIRKVRVPIGVIGIIFEARPNVTIDCAILCLKSGNAAILRGGKEIFHTNQARAALIAQALAGAGLSADCVQLVPTTDRAALEIMLRLSSLIHCIIPRGGESLIRFVTEHSTIPVIKHYNGICFVYVDAEAEPAMAESILINAKVPRPGVCNAAEQLLVHASLTKTLLPQLAAALVAQGVELRCDQASGAALDAAGVKHRDAKLADYTTEFLGLILAVRVVDSLEADESAARRFLAAVDSAVVLWNASTRFNDGFEFGYGAEIGISTDRLHARGPMGLRELCSHKFQITGTGQIRN